MIIKELHIKNYKSLVDFKIIEPNPFTVFAGSNGAGKSNIFEALEFLSLGNMTTVNGNLLRLFGGDEAIVNFNTDNRFLEFNINLEFDHYLILNSIQNNQFHPMFRFFGKDNYKKIVSVIAEETEQVNKMWNDAIKSQSYNQFFEKFNRIFIGNQRVTKQILEDDFKLNISCSNLEKVLKRVLKDENKREDICEWLDLLVPGFEKIEIVSEPLSGTDSLIIYEKGTKKPYTKNLLSDGTYNILALLTAVYQSDEPQFLCIEEPENGLNPKVQKELVNLFRQKCEEEGHYIWINTHSQTIVKQLTNKELILVDKIDGATQIKQLTDFDNHGLPMDEAWLTNSLGGGIPW